MRNTLRRQNEATERKRLKSDYYEEEIKKLNLVTYNSVSIITPCRELYLSLYKTHPAILRNTRENSYCVYTRCIFILIQVEQQFQNLLSKLCPEMLLEADADLPLVEKSI